MTIALLLGGCATGTGITPLSLRAGGATTPGGTPGAVRESPALVQNPLTAVKDPPLPERDNAIPFEHFSLDQGLSQSVAETLLQDRLGFLWIGTQDGINRYDGYGFKVFKHDPTDPYSLSDNFINAAVEDSSGVLWIGTGNGLNRYDPKTGRFTHFFHDSQDPFSLSDHNINALFVDRSNDLWIGTIQGGLNRLQLGAAVDQYISPDLAATVTPGSETPGILPPRFIRYTLPGNGDEGQGVGSVCAIYQDRLGIIWVGTEHGLYRLDPGEDSFTVYRHDPSDPTSLADDHVTTIFQDRQGDLWLGTYRGGLDRFQRETGEFSHYANNPDDPTSLSHNHIEAIFRDRAGNLWIGTDGGGLDRFDPILGRFYHHQAVSYDLSSLGSNQVHAILQDRDGILWVGTFGSGLAKFNPAVLRFHHLANNPNDENSLSSNFIWGMAEDDQGRIWIGTAGGGLNAWDRRSGKFTHYLNDPDEPGSISSNTVWYVYIDRDHTLWVGTEAGLDRFDPQTGGFTHYPMSPVWSIFEDDEGNLWIGSFSDGLGKFDRATGGVTWYRHDPENPASLGNDGIFKIYQDRGGQLWVGTFGGGINRFDPRNGRFTRYQSQPDNPDSLAHNVVLSIYEDSFGRFWVGTFGGLDQFHPSTGDFTHLTEKDGLPDNVIYGILEDNQGNLWMSTNRGISRYDPRTGVVRNFTRRDGLQSNEFNQSAYLKTRAGQLIFGGVNGINAFSPAEVSGNSDAPTVALTGFQLFNQPVQPSPDGPLEQTIETAPQINLPYQQNYLAFEFTALDFSAPEKNQYAYRLEGLDRDWNYSGNRNYASYPNLSPGSYVFRVKGANPDGVWNETGSAIAVTIKPPFWRTTWFSVLMGLLLVGSVVGVIGYRARAVALQRRNLENMVEERTLALSQALAEVESARVAAEQASRAKSAFLANISHELRTPLNAILGFSQLMLRSSNTTDEQRLTGEQRRSLEVINHSGEHLLGLINDVLEMSKIEAGRITLNLQSFDLVRLLTELEEMFHLRAEAKRLWLSFEIDPCMARHVYADEGKLRQVLLNLLGNAVKFTERGGVRLVATMLPCASPQRAGMTHRLHIEVQDSGPGIKSEELSQIFEPFVQADNAQNQQEGTGLGLSISRQYARLMGGDITVQSTVDLGSTFILDIPLQAVDPAAVVPTCTQRVIGLAPGQPVYRLLVVDDQSVNRDLLVNILRPLGFELREAVNGQQALDTWRAWQPHLVWLDMRMPVMDGYEATKQIKAAPGGQATVIIALTASALEEDRAAILAQGCDDYIRKPFREAELFAALEKHLGVEFIYEEEAPETGLQPEFQAVQVKMDELSTRLQKMPVEKLAALRQSVVLGYWHQVEVQVDEISAFDPGLGAALRELAENFEQDRMIGAIDQVMEMRKNDAERGNTDR